MHVWAAGEANVEEKQVYEQRGRQLVDVEHSRLSASHESLTEVAGRAESGGAANTASGVDPLALSVRELEKKMEHDTQDRTREVNIWSVVTHTSTHNSHEITYTTHIKTRTQLEGPPI